MNYEIVIPKVIHQDRDESQIIFIKQYENKYTHIKFTDLVIDPNYKYFAIYKMDCSNTVYEIPLEDNVLTIGTFISNFVGTYKMCIVATNDDEKVVIADWFRIVVEAGIYNTKTAEVVFPQPIQNKYEKLIELIDEVEGKLERGEFKGDTGNGIAYCTFSDYKLTLHFTDGTEYTTTSIRGEKGAKGDKGESGVYIGTTEPSPIDYPVWIDTDEEDTVVYSKTEVDENFARKEFDYSEPVPIFENASITFSKVGDSELYKSQQNPIVNFTKDDFDFNAIYKAVWDGKEYICYCCEYLDRNSSLAYSFYGIGDVSIVGHTKPLNTTQPFIAIYNYDNARKIEIFTKETDSNHTLSLYKINVNINNNAYIPLNTFDGQRYPFVMRGTGENSVVLNNENSATGTGAIAGGISSIASGLYSLAYGYPIASHKETGIYQQTEANGQSSVAIGGGSVTNGAFSFALGQCCTADGSASLAFGYYCKTNKNFQVAIGRFNELDDTKLFIVGNGTSVNDRKNIFTVDKDGNGEFIGDVKANQLTLGETSINEEELQGLLDAGDSLQDVQVNGTSIVENGVASIPVASMTGLGLAQPGTTLTSKNGVLDVAPGSQALISSRSGLAVITGSNLDYAVRQAFCDQKGTSWSENERQYARNRLSVLSGLQTSEMIANEIDAINTSMTTRINDVYSYINEVLGDVENGTY